MATASLLEAIAVLRDPPKSRQTPLRWNPFFQKLHYRSPIKNPRFIWVCHRSTLKPAASTSEEGNPIMRTILEALRALQKPLVAAVLLGVLLTVDPYTDLAASGGRMGGGGFYVGPMFGAGSGFFTMIMGLAAVILLSGFLSDRADDGSVLTEPRSRVFSSSRVEENEDNDQNISDEES